MNPGEFLAKVEATMDEMDRQDASGWLVVCIDLDAVSRDEPDVVVGCYGPFASPEEALVEAGHHQATSLPTDDAGWAHLIKPLFPPVRWKT